MKVTLLLLLITVAGVYQVTSQAEDQDQYLDELEHLSGGNQHSPALPCPALHYA